MKVIIEEYRESWAKDFSELSGVISKTLEVMNVSIDHIGSTSVKGLGAKPIIDILIGVEDESCLDKTITPMQQNGFTYYKKYERPTVRWTAWPERRHYVKLKPLTDQMPPVIIDHDEVPGKNFTSYSSIHTLVKNTDGWKRHIAFRDFLRAHDDIRDEYYLLKKEIIKQEFENMLKYNDAKNDFVKDVERRAIVWYGKQSENR
ncbi:MAG: GrpB family protein [Ignavibacteria bacterium]